MELIAIESVSKRFKNGNETLTVLNSIEAKFYSKECIGIIGVSGSGKSTLLNLIGALDEPDEGNIFIDGENIGKLSEKEKARLRAEKIGFVFQAYNLEPRYTVYQNVEIPLLLTQISSKEKKRIITNVLETVGMLDNANKKVGVLSGGEKQRVAIARALVRSPRIILADEPCGNLDCENSRKIMELLRKLSDDDRLVLIVTHDMSAKKYFHRVIEIKDGTI